MPAVSQRRAKQIGGRAVLPRTPNDVLGRTVSPEGVTVGNDPRGVDNQKKKDSLAACCQAASTALPLNGMVAVSSSSDVTRTRSDALRR